MRHAHRQATPQKRGSNALQFWGKDVRLHTKVEVVINSIQTSFVSEHMIDLIEAPALSIDAAGVSDRALAPT